MLAHRNLPAGDEGRGIEKQDPGSAPERDEECPTVAGEESGVRLGGKAHGSGHRAPLQVHHAQGVSQDLEGEDLRAV